MRTAITLITFVASALLVSAAPAPVEDTKTVYVTLCPTETASWGSSVGVQAPSSAGWPLPLPSSDTEWSSSAASSWGGAPTLSSPELTLPTTSGSGWGSSSVWSFSEPAWPTSSSSGWDASPSSEPGWPASSSSSWGSAPTWPLSEPWWLSSPSSTWDAPTGTASSSAASPTSTSVTLGQCSRNIKCCESVVSPDFESFALSSLDISTADIGLVGINCLDVDVSLGIPFHCSADQTPACCDNTDDDLISVNCAIIDVDL